MHVLLKYTRWKKHESKEILLWCSRNRSWERTVYYIQKDTVFLHSRCLVVHFETDISLSLCLCRSEFYVWVKLRVTCIKKEFFAKYDNEFKTGHKLNPLMTYRYWNISHILFIYTREFLLVLPYFASWSPVIITCSIYCLHLIFILRVFLLVH